METVVHEELLELILRPGGSSSLTSVPSPRASRDGSSTFVRFFIALYTRPSSSTWTTKVCSGVDLQLENDNRTVLSATPKSFAQFGQAATWSL